MTWVNNDTVDFSKIQDTGWCLSDVQNAFNAPHRYASAIEEWNNQTQYNHAGENPPTTANVPVYYGPHAENNNYGHVTIGNGDKAWYKGKWVNLHFTAASYLGWSEATGGYRQIDWVEDAPAAGGLTGTVLVDGLRIRTQPSLSAAVVGALNAGDTVTYTDTTVAEDYVWLHLTDGNYAAVGRYTGQPEDDDFIRV